MILLLGQWTDSSKRTR